MDIKIFVSCHKKCFIPKHELLFPVQVGAANAAEHFQDMYHDDEGENISIKNPMYCELTAQYWAWKNVDTDYYGFFHYRRYMSFADRELPHDGFQNVIYDYLNEDVLQELNFNPQAMRDTIGQYDVIATTETDLHAMDPILKSNYHQYVITDYQYIEDLDVMLDIIKEKYPDYYDTATKYLHSPKGYFCNMFIMKKELFQEYSKWLFDILSEHEKRRDYSSYSAMAYRVSGYLGERLFGIYYTYLKEHGAKCKELQRTLFNDVDIHHRIQPAFEQNNVAIALAANDFFAPYIATVIQSIMDHATAENNYDIIVMSQDMSAANKKLIDDSWRDISNVSIRYINPLPYMDVKNLFVRGHFSYETYYRLALYEMLPDYDKILYLDADLVVMDDVAKLYAEDMTGFLIGAALDADTAGLYNGYEPGKKNYMDNILKIKEPYKYFQAGVVILNLEEFRKTFKLPEILQFSGSYEWELLDQDILNYLCQGRVKYVDMAWNVMVDFDFKRIREIIGIAPYHLNKMYHEARREPKIIHYAGPQKPWTSPEMDLAPYFWQYARKTPFNEIILGRMMASVSKYVMDNQFSFGTKIRKAVSWRLRGVRRKIAYVRQYVKVKRAKG